MGVIPGYIRDEVVVVGNHRDGIVKYLIVPVLKRSNSS